MDIDTLTLVIKAQVSGATKEVSKLVGAMKKLTNPLSSFGKASDKTFKSALMTVMKYAFGIRSLYILVRKLKSAIADGFKNLAQYSDTTNSSISNLQASMMMLKNSMAAAFNPVLNAISAGLSAIIQKIAQVFNAIGALMGALTGARSVVQATKASSNYAAGIASGTGKAAKNAKKLKTYLLGIDELNVIHEDEDNDSNSGGGGGGANINDMFDTIETPEWAKDLAEMIKKAWEDADFTSIGRLIGEKLKGCLEVANSYLVQKGRPLAEKIAKSIATLLNGFLETDGLWVEMGTLIGNGINTALGSVVTFMQNFHYDSLGSAITQTIYNAFKTTDFSLISNYISETLIGTMDFIRGLIEGIDWEELPSTIWTKITEFISGIEWFELASSLGQLIAEAIEGISDLVTGICELVGQKITDAISNGMTLSDIILSPFQWIWDNIITPIVSGFIDGFYKASDSEEIKAAGDSIVEGIADGMKNAGDWFFDALSELISSIGNFISEKWDILKEAGSNLWHGIVDGFTGGSDSTNIGVKASEDVSTGIESGGSKVRTASHKLGDDFGDGFKMSLEGNQQKFKQAAINVGDVAIEGLRTSLDSHSPSKVTESIGLDFVDGFNQGIVKNGESTIAIVQQWVESIKTAFGGETGEGFFSGVIEGIMMSWTEFIAWWDDTCQSWLTTNQTTTFSQATWYTVANGFYLGITKKWTDFEKFWKTSINAWMKGFVEPFFAENLWKSFGDNMANGIYKGFSACVSKVGMVCNGIIDAMNNAGESIANAMNTLISSYNSLAGTFSAPSASNLTYSKASHVAIPRFYDGGFLSDLKSYSLFTAGENGVPEMMGTVGGKSAVASGAEITGIRDAVYDSSIQETTMLQTVIGLLQIIADKDPVGLTDEDIAKANIRGSRNIGLNLRTI